MTAAVIEKPIRVAVFNTPQEADQVVAALLGAGFTKAQISVICSDDQIQKRFHDYEHLHAAGTDTLAKIVKWATICGLVGAAGALVIMLTSGFGVGIAWTAIVAPAGAVFGGMIGGMMSEGAGGELAEFYEQAVPEGKILVAAEDHGTAPHEKLARAAAVFAKAGAQAIELSAG